jgi:two-component SAPR family response regulator
MTHVLLVEPDLITRSFLESDLQSQGYTLSKCKDTEEAYTVLKQISPDVIICDMYRYPLSSLILLQFMRKNSLYDHTVFIGLYTEKNIHEVRDAMLIGADDFIIKPFEPDELIRTLKVRLARRRQLQPAITPIKYLNKLQIRGFDALAIAYEGEPLSCSSSKGLEIVFYLLENRKASSLELCEALYPGIELEQALSRMHGTLHRTKKQFGQDIIQYQGGRYSIKANLQIDYDIQNYRNLAEYALEQDQSGLLQRAINLYGEALAELCGVWCDRVRNALMKLQIQMLERVILLYQQDKIKTMALYNLEQLLKLGGNQYKIEMRIEMLLKELHGELLPSKSRSQMQVN